MGWGRRRKNRYDPESSLKAPKEAHGFLVLDMELVLSMEHFDEMGWSTDLNSIPDETREEMRVLDRTLVGLLVQCARQKIAVVFLSHGFEKIESRTRHFYPGFHSMTQNLRIMGCLAFLRNRSWMDTLSQHQLNDFFKDGWIEWDMVTYKPSIVSDECVKRYIGMNPLHMDQLVRPKRVSTALRAGGVVNTIVSTPGESPIERAHLVDYLTANLEYMFSNYDSMHIDEDVVPRAYNGQEYAQETGEDLFDKYEDDWEYARA